MSNITLLFLFKLLVVTHFNRRITKGNIFAHSTVIGINFPYIWFPAIWSSYLYNANSYNGKASALFEAAPWSMCAHCQNQKQHVQYPTDATAVGTAVPGVISLFHTTSDFFFRYATHYISSIYFPTFISKVLFETVDFDRNDFEKGIWYSIGSSLRAG